MRVRFSVLAIFISSILFAGGPPQIPKDATAVEVIRGNDQYELALQDKSAPKVTASINFESIKPTVDDNSCYGLGFIVADIERKGQTFNKIQTLSVKWNGKSVSIPNTAYNQLLNINYIYIFRIKNITILRIIGGDGGSAYICDLKFDNKFLRMKGIYLAEFPDICSEVTRYKYNETMN